MIRSLALLGALAMSAMALAQPFGGPHRGRDGGKRQIDLQGVPAVLRRAIEGAPDLRYSGTRVVRFRRGGESRRHVEYVTRDGKFTRVEFPSDSPQAGQVIVEGPKERRHFFPDRNEIRVLPPRRDEAFSRLVRLVRQARSRYTLAASGSETVAGIRTDEVVVSDRSGNVVQRLFIEPKTGLLLKRQIFDPVGAPVAGFEFTKVDLTPRIERGIFRLERRGAKVVTPADLLQSVAKSGGFLATVIPPKFGYRLEGSAVRRFGEEDALVSFYTSNKGRLTLFQMRSAVRPEMIERMGRGDVRVVTWQKAGRTFVLLGNLDEATLNRIATSVPVGTGS